MTFKFNKPNIITKPRLKMETKIFTLIKQKWKPRIDNWDGWNPKTNNEIEEI